MRQPVPLADRFKPGLLIALTVSLVCCAVASAEGPLVPHSSSRYLAIVGLKTLGDTGANSWIGIAVGEELATRLGSARQQIMTLERLQLNELLATKEQPAPMLALGEESAEADRHCASVLMAARSSRKLDGADALLLGSVICGPQVLKASTRLVNVETGAVEDAVLSEVSYTTNDPILAVQALAIDLTTKWCEKLQVSVSPEMRATTSDKTTTYEAWGKAREYLYQGKYEECLERVRWAESQVSDQNLLQGLLGTRDEAWEMQFAATQADPQRRDAFIKQMLDTAGSTYSGYKRAFATAAYYYGRALERAGQFKEAEVKYRECLEQRPSRVLWDVELNATQYGMAATNQTVYAAGDDGTLAAIDSGNGRELWRFHHAGESFWSPQVAGQVVCLDCSGMYVHCIRGIGRSTGALAWEFRSEYAHLFHSSGKGWYCTLSSGNKGLLRKFDPDSGKVLWDVELTGRVQPLGDTPGSLVEGPSCVYYVETSADQESFVLRARNCADGTQLWASEQLKTRPDSLPSVTFLNGRVYCFLSETHLTWRMLVWDGQSGKPLPELARTGRNWPRVAQAEETMYLIDGESVRRLGDRGDRDRWQTALPCNPDGAFTCDSTNVYVTAPKGIVALDAASGEVTWQSGIEAAAAMMKRQGDVLYVRDGNGVLHSLDARSGAELSHYTAEFTSPANWMTGTFELIGSGVVCYARKTGIRAIAMDAPTAVDIDADATAGLMRCLLATDRADVAWRFAARALLENPVRDSAFKVAAARAEQSSSLWRGPNLISFLSDDRRASGRTAMVWKDRASDERRNLNFMLYGDQVLCVFERGPAETVTEARDKRSGKLLWQDVGLASDWAWLDVTDGVLIVAASARRGSPDGWARALDPSTGELLWHREDTGGRFPTLDGAILLFTNDEWRGSVLAVAARTGQTLWQSERTGPSVWVSIDSCSEDAIYCDWNDMSYPFEARNTPRLQVLDPRTGRTLSCTEVDGKWFRDGRVIHILVRDPKWPRTHEPTPYIEIKAVDALTGQALWKREIIQGGGWSVEAASGISYVSTAAGVEALQEPEGTVLWRRDPVHVDGRTINRTVSLKVGALCCLDTRPGFEMVALKTGEPRWHFDWGWPTFAANGAVYVADGYGRLAALDAHTGNIRWARDTGLRQSRLASEPSPEDVIILSSGFVSESYSAFKASSGERLWEVSGIGSHVSRRAKGGKNVAAIFAGGAIGKYYYQLMDLRTGRMLAQTLLRRRVGSCEVEDDKAWLSIDDHLVALDLDALRAAAGPREIYLSDGQYCAYSIWGKGGLAVQKSLDGIPLSQIVRYDHWQSAAELSVEINRLASLPPWDGEKALAADPATLCPPFLKVDAELTKQGVCAAAQVFASAAQSVHRTFESSVAEVEYRQEAARLAPRWDEVK